MEVSRAEEYAGFTDAERSADLYDSVSGRWFASCSDDKTRHHLYIAVSTSSDPTKPWRGIQTPFECPDFGFRMGVDEKRGCDVRISDGAMLREGLVDDPNADYTHPSLAVDAAGNIGIGCTRTSANEFPSAYVMMHAAIDPASSMLPPVKAVAGTTYFRFAKFKSLPLGNYSTTCIDPSDPRRLWTYQEYANSASDGGWRTAWASFQFDGASDAPGH